MLFNPVASEDVFGSSAASGGIGLVVDSFNFTIIPPDVSRTGTIWILRQWSKLWWLSMTYYTSILTIFL